VPSSYKSLIDLHSIALQHRFIRDRSWYNSNTGKGMVESGTSEKSFWKKGDFTWTEVWVKLQQVGCRKNLQGRVKTQRKGMSYQGDHGEYVTAEVHRTLMICPV
jgi:hypothetical protein